MSLRQWPASWVVILLGILIGAVLTVAAGIGLALLRPESSSMLRTGWGS